MRWQSLSHLSYHSCRHLLYCKTIVVPNVDTNAKVTKFFPFCTIGISMYQKRILPYFIIPHLIYPKLLPLWSVPDRQRDRFQHPFHPYFFFFSTERAGPYPQVQLYWAGQTMGWMADWTRNHFLVSSEPFVGILFESSRLRDSRKLRDSWKTTWFMENYMIHVGPVETT